MAATQATGYLFSGNHSFFSVTVGLIEMLVSGLLCLGLLTPIASTAAGLSILLIPFLGIAEPAWNVLDRRVTTFLVVVMSAVAVLVGPGAFSLDSHIFGRREIIIPRSPGAPKH